MKITKTQLERIIMQEITKSIDEIHAASPPHRAGSKNPKPFKYHDEESSSFKGRGTAKKRDFSTKKDDQRDHRPSGQRLGKWHMYEEMDDYDLAEEIRLIAAEAIYAVEDAELIERIRDILPLQMKHVVEGKLTEFKSSLNDFIQSKLAELANDEKLEEEQPLQKLAKGIEKRGTEGDFSEWCGGEVTQACIDRAAKEGGKRAKQASLAVTFSKAKGGGKTLKYPKKKD